MKRIIVTMVGLVLPLTAFAQRLPDPDKVDPQYHDAAERRRAEMIHTKMCTDQAAREKVLKRDLAAYINHCLTEKADATEVQKTKQ